MLCAFSCLVLPSQGKPSVAVPLAGPDWVGADGLQFNDTAIYHNIVVKDIGKKYSIGFDTKAIVVDNNGLPCIAWSGYAQNNFDIYFTRWNGSKWVNAYGNEIDTNNCNVSNSIGDSYYPSLAIDKDNNPHISWMDSTQGLTDIYYAYFSDNNWVNAYGDILSGANGNITSNPRESLYPKLSINNNGYPCIAWDDYSPGYDYLMYIYFNGTNWCNIQGEIFTGTNATLGAAFNYYQARHPQVCGFEIDYQGKPNILYSWKDDGAYNYISVIKWDGSKWNDFIVSKDGPDGWSFRGGYGASMCKDENGYPVIVWSSHYIGFYRNDPGGSEIFLIKWDGNKWVNVNNQYYDKLEVAQITHNNCGGITNVVYNNNIIYIL